MPLLDNVPVINVDKMPQFYQDELGLYCLSQRDVALIQSMMRLASFVTRYVDDTGKTLIEQGRLPEIDENIELAQLVDWRLNQDMCEPLTEAINQLTAVLSTASAGGNGCGCGTSGTSEDPPPNPDDTGDITQPGGTPPEGFATWEEYQDYKCEVAAWIVKGYLSDVQWLQTQNLVALTIAGLIIGLVTPLPGSRLIAILAVIASIAGYGQSVLQEVEDALTNAQDDLICALYTASNAQEALDWLREAFVAQLELETADPIARTLGRQLFSGLSAFTHINYLFENTEEIKPKLTPYDCSACAQPCEDFLNTTSWDSIELSPGEHWIELVPPQQCCFEVSGETFTGYTPLTEGFSAVNYALCSDPGTELTHLTDAETFDFSGKCFAYCSMRSNTSWTFDAGLASCT